MSDKEDPVQKYAKDLKESISKTRECRFNAARRLSNKNQLSIASISFVSVYSIAIAIIQNIFDFSECKNLNNVFTIVSILLSIFILVVSLLEGANNYQLKADRLHSNAIELSAIAREIKCLKILNLSEKEYREKLCELGNQYENKIKNCPENHNPLDYELFKVEENKSLDCWDRFWRRTWFRCQNYWLYITFIIMPIPTLCWLYQIFKCS
ncbi:MAG: SLATT domain-containing protein [Prochloraceae cyanobacterium]